jgi:hypothetical protein
MIQRYQSWAFIQGNVSQDTIKTLCFVELCHSTVLDENQGLHPRVLPEGAPPHQQLRNDSL